MESKKILREVVLCKDCEYSNNNVSQDKDDYYCDRTYKRLRVEADGFCKWGKEYKDE